MPKCECFEDKTVHGPLVHKTCWEIEEHVCSPCECDCHYE